MKNNSFHKWLLAIILPTGFLLFAQNICAQSPSVSASVDKNNILIGEQFHYRVVATMPDNTYRLSWFNLQDTLGHFRIVKENKIDSSYANGNLGFSQDIVLTSFDSGMHVIPPLILNMETLQGDSTFNLVTDSIRVGVSFAPMDSVATFHDIKSIIEVKKQWPWWWWAILALVVLLLLFWIRFLIKFFRKKKEDPGFFDSKLSPFDEAMKSLTDLEEEQLLQNGETKQYHTRLTSIFKRYVSRKTRSYKMHLTSDELLMELDAFDLGKEQLFAFANSLRMSNAVKFAKFMPSPSESEKCLAQTKEMITDINKNLNKKPESDI